MCFNTSNCISISHVIAKKGFLENDLDDSIPAEDEFLIDTFPENFMWGVATAAYQTEGAVKEGGKKQ